MAKAIAVPNAQGSLREAPPASLLVGTFIEAGQSPVDSRTWKQTFVRASWGCTVTLDPRALCSVWRVCAGARSACVSVRVRSVRVVCVRARGLRTWFAYKCGLCVWSAYMVHTRAGLRVAGLCVCGVCVHVCLS